MRCCYMKPLDRDTHILEHIVSYCQQIEETVARFGNDGSIFFLRSYLSKRSRSLYPAEKV